MTNVLIAVSAACFAVYFLLRQGTWAIQCAMPSDEPSKPSRRRWRGFAAAAGAAFMLVAVAVAAALFYREDLASAALRNRLLALGFENPRFSVEHLTAASVAIADFSAGQAMSFDRLTVDFSATEILDGRVARIELSGLRADLTQREPWDGLRRRFAGEEKGSARGKTAPDLSILPAIDIRQARVRLPGPGGPMTVTATASLRRDPKGNLAVKASATATGATGNIEGTYEGTIRNGADGGTIAAGRLSAESESLKMGAAALGGLKIALPLSADLTTDGKITVVTERARFEATRFDLASGIATAVLGVTVTGRLASAEISGGQVDMEADVAIDAKNIRAGTTTAGRGTATLPLRIKARPQEITVATPGDGMLALEGLRMAENAPPTAFSTLLSGKVAMSWPSDNSGGLSIDHTLSIAPAPVTLPGAPDIQATTGKIEASGRLAADGAYRGQVTMGNGRFTRGSQSVAVANLETRLDTGPRLANPGARITIDSVRDMSAATAFGAPIGGTYSLTASVRQNSSGLSYDAEIGGLGMGKLATIAGLHDPATDHGHMDIMVPTLRLGAGGVEPSSVIPALRPIRKVAGGIGGDARLTWHGGNLTGRAGLRLEGLGGETDDGTVEGISGTIEIDSLAPLTTAPEQVLTISRIASAAVLTDTSIRFTLLPSGSLSIGRAETSLAGGKLIVEAPAIDPIAQRAEATATLQGIRLERLLDLFDSGELTASGTIHGSIPIRIVDGKTAIDSGALSSQGGGTLRFKSERAKQILKGGGEQVQLMLQALENFSYERLDIDIRKSLDGGARVTLRTLGLNKSVLKGRKFQINVNLETNLDRLLAAAVEWYQLSGRAWRDIVSHGMRKRNSQK